MKNKIDPFVELAVWAHLDAKTDLEMILLKGHLLLEMILDTALCRISVEDSKKFSFYRKVSLLKSTIQEPLKEPNLFLIHSRK